MRFKAVTFLSLFLSSFGPFGHSALATDNPSQNPRCTRLFGTEPLSFEQVLGVDPALINQENASTFAAMLSREVRAIEEAGRATVTLEELNSGSASAWHCRIVYSDENGEALPVIYTTTAELLPAEQDESRLSLVLSGGDIEDEAKSTPLISVEGARNRTIQTPDPNYFSNANCLPSFSHMAPLFTWHGTKIAPTVSQTRLLIDRFIAYREIDRNHPGEDGLHDLFSETRGNLSSRERQRESGISTVPMFDHRSGMTGEIFMFRKQPNKRIERPRPRMHMALCQRQAAVM